MRTLPALSRCYASSQIAPVPTAKPPLSPLGERLKSRRKLIWASICAFLAVDFLMFLRFFFPRTLFEPSSRFRIGYPSDFGPGVDERFKQSHRVWVVRRPDRLFVVYAKCTHLGCTPNWIESENKFKCPCHGSGYDMEGRNFEGPAPRPMDRKLRNSLSASGTPIRSATFSLAKGPTRYMPSGQPSGL